MKSNRKKRALTAHSPDEAHRKDREHIPTTDMKSEYDIFRSQLSRAFAERQEILKGLVDLAEKMIETGTMEPRIIQLEPAPHYDFDDENVELVRLRQRISQLQSQSDAFRRALGALMSDHIFEFDEEKALANVGQRPTIDELIAELESTGAP